MDYRRDVQHENINDESWLITNEKNPFVTSPKKLSYFGIKKLLGRALKDEGVRDLLPEGGEMV